ncbi:DUF1631 family protein [Aliikangiella sp. IMCC44359]|uniref:DUF1631 family protein n=1 Tax=Aliikangiella sp. IMCC44359 TaxID=3459125 RepID=UPI00403ACDC8
MPKDSVSSNDEVILKNEKPTVSKKLLQKYLTDETQLDTTTNNDAFLSLIQDYLNLAPNQKKNDKKQNLTNLESRLIPYLNQSEYALSQSQLNLLKLVDQLFNYVLSDTSLKQPIKQNINQISPIYLMLLVQDPNVVTETHHPTKRLLNSIAKVGLLWEPGTTNSKLISQQITQIIEQLKTAAKTPSSLSETFKKAANQFEDFTNTLIKRAEIFEKRIREAEEGKAKAETAKQQANKVLKIITCKQSIPPFIRQMLEEAWQHVIFLEVLKDSEIPQTNALYIAKALLVSIQSISEIDELAKFVELQNDLIPWLKQELEKTSYSFAEVDAFFAELDNLHNEIIADVKNSLEQGPKEEILRLKPSDPYQNNHEDTDTQPQRPSIPIDDMSVEQWVDFSFNNIPSDKTTVIEKTKPKTRQQKDLAASEKRIRLLKPGDWLIIKQNDEEIRCKLASYIQTNDKYILVNGIGNKVAEHDTSTLAIAYQNKNIQILESAPLFERAHKIVLDNLVKQLEEESQKEKLKKLEALQAKKAEAKKKEAAEKLIEKNKKAAEESTSKTKKTTTKSDIKDPIIKKQPSTKPSQQPMPDFSRLAVGSWVEIQVDEKLKKCRLAAKIASSGKFIFTDRSGIKIKECFIDELKELYLSQKLVLEQENDLFDQALASVISNLRNLKSDNS